MIIIWTVFKLDLTLHFLYHNISKQNYDGIYFLKQETPSRHFLEAKKKSPYTAWIEISGCFPVEAGYLGGMIYKNRNSTEKTQTVLYAWQKKAILTRIQILMKQDKKYAFVIPLSMMLNLLRTGTFRENLRAASDGNKDNCMILLVASKAAEDLWRTVCSGRRRCFFV